MKGNAGRKSVLLSQMSGIWPNGMFHFLANEETMRLVPQRCDAINAKIHFLEKKGVKKEWNIKTTKKTIVAISFFFDNVIFSIITKFFENEMRTLVILVI